VRVERRVENTRRILALLRELHDLALMDEAVVEALEVIDDLIQYFEKYLDLLLFVMDHPECELLL